MIQGDESAKEVLINYEWEEELLIDRDMTINRGKVIYASD